MMKLLVRYGMALPITIAVGLSLNAQTFAAITPAATATPATTAIEGVPVRSPLLQGESLLAINSRLRFRVNVRPSRYRVGGIARSAPCAPGSTATLTAMVPPTRTEEIQSVRQANDPNPNRYRAVDTTVSPHPTILVHVPAITGARSVQFTLQHEDPNRPQLYRAELPLANQAGVWGIRIPNSVALEVGETYLWQMQVICASGNNPFRGPFTSSWIRRVATTEHPALRGVESLPLGDRPDRYAEAGVWLDTLSTLAELRHQTPNNADVNAAWTSVLQSVGLDNVAIAPIVQMVGYPSSRASSQPVAPRR